MCNDVEIFDEYFLRDPTENTEKGYSDRFFIITGGSVSFIFDEVCTSFC